MNSTSLVKFSMLENLNSSQFLNMLIHGDDGDISLSSEDCEGFEKLEILEDQVILDFNLVSEFLEDKKDVFEAKLYIQRSKDLKILVNQTCANTFRLSDQVELNFFNRKAVIEFSLIEGEGNFWGHIFYSNRPSKSIKDPFQSFDWMIGLRTVKRPSTCRIRAKLSFF